MPEKHFWYQSVHIPTNALFDKTPIYLVGVPIYPAAQAAVQNAWNVVAEPEMHFQGTLGFQFQFFPHAFICFSFLFFASNTFFFI